MVLYILNQTFQRVAVIDQYSSIIWTRRYWDVGDFELYVPADPDLLQYLQIGFYVFREDCESTMMIEHIEIKTDAENGNYFIISGRGVENILSYRVVANAGSFSALLKYGSLQIMDTCAASLLLNRSHSNVSTYPSM